ncbi:hypothetical protein BMS3Bbin01_01348 [bacterium BMS3Bbin01]|nr:hypothetical protein BMS3Bbin01_01348 [bacterium BMS3Bbin01]
MPRVTVSGSFHRHLPAIEEAVAALRDLGVVVLSPEDPRVVDAEGPFLFVASDRHRAVRLVQDRHLASIAKSDFVWLVCPDGYVGSSAAAEIGFAVAYGVPVFSTHIPADLTLQEYVWVVGDLSQAVKEATYHPRLASPRPSLLVSPEQVVAEAHRSLEELESLLTGRTGSLGPEVTHRVTEVVDDLDVTLRPLPKPAR